MSSKTTFKRLALVAVAALGLGVLSVAPSSAANTVLTFGTGDAAGADNASGYAVAGAFNYATVNVTSPAGDYVFTTDSTFVGQGSATTGVLSTDAKSLSMTAASTGVRVATPAVGTVTVKYWVRTNGILAATAAESVVIPVNASAQSGTFAAANSTVIVNSGETVTATADATIAAVATSNVETAVATIAVSLKDTLKAAYNDTVTATVIAGGANVRTYTDSTTVTTDGVAGIVSSAVLSAGGKAYVSVFANSTAGPATIQLSLSNGTVVAQKIVTFSSTTVSTLTATVAYGYVSSTGTAGAITVVAKDAAGNVINGASISATSGDTTKIASPSSVTTASGKASFTVAAASATAAGAASITFKSGTASTTASITAAGVKATKLAVTADAASAAAGDKVTFTMTVADANGPLADGDYVGVFVSAPVTSNGATGAFASDTVTVKNGVATSAIYLPFVAGNYTSTWTLKGTAGTATTNLDAALTGTTAAITVTVANPSADAATDAANEATDAADAVAALSATVSKLVASLKAQITTLTNLVIKIQKKVKA